MSMATQEKPLDYLDAWGPPHPSSKKKRARLSPQINSKNGTALVIVLLIYGENVNLEAKFGSRKPKKHGYYKIPRGEQLGVNKEASADGRCPDSSSESRRRPQSRLHRRQKAHE